MSIVIFTKCFLVLKVTNMTVVTLGLSDNFNLRGICIVEIIL
jgi:hypothetical protein